MNTIIKSIFIAVFMFSSISCSDYFELERPWEEPWTTVDDFERVPVGIYAALFSGHEWNMFFVNERIIKSSMGDDVGYVRNPEWGYHRQTKQYNKYTERIFAVGYRAIAAANHALDFVAENNGYPYERIPAVEEQFKKILGQIYFLRGYAYYTLETMFGHAYVPLGGNSSGDIPMPVSLAKTLEEAKNPKIGTTQEVWELILSDFLKAKELLPKKFVGDADLLAEFRPNQFAAAAMLMRTYMQRGEYAQALEECDFIINQNGGEYNLSEDPIEAFNKTSSPARGAETIFFVPFVDEQLAPPSHLSVLNQRFEGKPTDWVETYMTLSTVQRLGFMDNPSTDTTINDKAKRDKRFSQLMAVRYPQNKHKPTQAFETRQEIRNLTTIFTNKYYRSSPTIAGMRTNVPLIRLAEVYLTRSILRLKANNASGAADDLNVVRRRAWDEVVAGEPYTDVTPGEITEEMINDERLIEMFNEGDRIDYLKALKVPIPKGDRGDGTDPYTSESFFWAIPALEVDFNEGI